jgi:hypothetical protein
MAGKGWKAAGGALAGFAPHVDRIPGPPYVNFMGKRDLPMRRHAEASRHAFRSHDVGCALLTISPNKVVRLLGTPKGPALLDVRTDEDFTGDPRLIPGSLRRDASKAAAWDQIALSARRS